MYINCVDLDTSACTKRQILSEMSKQYDPLGLVLSVTIRGRMLVKGIWERKVYDWDYKIPEEITCVEKSRKRST